MTDHPYPDHAYLERDDETNEKRWFSIKGMGVRYVHEDRVAEDIEAAVKAERERCAMVLLNGRFLHDEAPTKMFAIEAAAAIRRQP